MTRLRQMFAPALLAAAFTVAPAFSQVETRFKVDVPFKFMAGNKTLPSGEYVIRGEIASHVVTLQNPSENKAAAVLTFSALKPEAPGTSMLVFHRIGDRYYLASVWSASNNIGRKLMKSSSEREAEKAAQPIQLAYVRATVQ